MLKEYNQIQEKINKSFSQEAEIIKRKSDDDQSSEDAQQICDFKKTKVDHLAETAQDGNIISKHAKYFKFEFI